MATFYYAAQIYCDFSGYTDMAIGSARLLGINLTINFNKPYLAVSIADFWRRWHISFSSWIFDYIFKPVQMNLRQWKLWANPTALLVTFFLSGIWHGASWGFVIWGLLHGFYMAAYALLSPYEKKILRKYKLENSKVVSLFQTGFTFFLVCFAWIFFRANNLADGWYVAVHMFSGLGMLPQLLTNLTHPASAGQGQGLFVPLTFDLNLIDLGLAVLGILIVFAVELPKKLSATWLGAAFTKSTPFRWFVYWLLTMSILVLGAITQSEFVYFRF